MKKGKEKIQEEITEEKLSDMLTENQAEKSEEQNSEEDEEKKDIEIEDNEEDKLREEIESLREEKVRLLAEMENLRKRFERDKIDSIKYGSVNFAREILSPGDNLERALSAIDKEEDHPESIKNLIDGLLMVKKELSTALEKNGITKIETKNKKFDPNLHQAMMEIENDDLEEGIVIQEIQTGYMIHDRLLRPAMVGVSKKSKHEEESELDTDTKSKFPDSKKNPQN